MLSADRALIRKVRAALRSSRDVLVTAPDAAGVRDVYALDPDILLGVTADAAVARRIAELATEARYARMREAGDPAE